jgi:hypothetical protein
MVEDEYKEGVSVTDDVPLREAMNKELTFKHYADYNNLDNA